MSCVRVRTDPAGSSLFDLQSPNWDLLSRRTIGHSLGNLARFNGHGYDDEGGDIFYSVAQHAVLCACLAYRMGMPYDYVFAALRHDDTEAVTGDVVTPIKKAVPALAHFLMQLELSYADYIQLPIISSQVKLVDTIMYAYECMELFSNDDSLGMEKEMLYQHHEHLTETLIPWSPDIASKAYVMAFNSLGNNSAYALPAIITACNAQMMNRSGVL